MALPTRCVEIAHQARRTIKRRACFAPSVSHVEGAMAFERILAIGAMAALLLASPAEAQKSGGVLKIYFFDSPATMSIHEESTIAGQGPMMGVFNNLVMYDPNVPQSGLKSVVPDLATEWAWDEARTALSFKLRSGVKWHDGKPFGARD